MKKVTLIFYLLTAGIATNAQLFSSEIVGKYGQGVTTRVYEIFFKTLISNEKQLKAAEIYRTEDSLISLAVKNRSSLQTIKRIADSSKVLINNLLSYEEKQKLNSNDYGKFFDLKGRLIEEVCKRRFAADSNIVKALKIITLSKDQSILKALDQKGSASSIDDSIVSKIIASDSLTEKYVVAAKGSSFFDKQIHRMDSVKQLSANEIIQLRKNYLSQCLMRGNNYSLNFNVAMQACIKDSFYYKILYQDSIETLAKAESRAEIEKYTYEYNLSPADIEKIRPILDARARQDVWLRTRYQYNRKRDSLQDLNNEISWLKIKNILIRSGYTALDKNSRIVKVMKMKSVLDITDSQLDTLSNRNLFVDIHSYFYRVSNFGATPDNDLLETNFLKQTLTQRQYDSLVILECQPQALANAKQAWSKLQKSGHTYGVDSSVVFKDILAYYLRSEIYAKRYSENPTGYLELLKDNRTNKPDILKHLDVTLKKQDE